MKGTAVRERNDQRSRLEMRSDPADSAEANPKGIEVGRLGGVNTGAGEQERYSEGGRWEERREE
jgi:hypothetical protein